MHPSSLGGRHMAETRALYQAFSRDNATSFDEYFTTKLPSTGALIGPFGLMLHTPSMGRAVLDVGKALRQLPGLKPKTAEIAVLTVCAQEQAHYELYARRRMASALGISSDEIDALVSGQCPVTLNGEERAAFHVARELCASFGSLSQWAWETAIIELGREGALALVHYIGYYRYLATIERGFDAQVPAEGDRVENR